VDHEIAVIRDHSADVLPVLKLHVNSSGNQLDSAAPAVGSPSPDEELPMLLAEMENLPTPEVSDSTQNNAVFENRVHHIRASKQQPP
jgi:hypothetical protein